MEATASKTALVALSPGSALPWPVVDAFLKQEALQAASLTFFTAPDSSASLGSGHAAGLSATSDQQHNREAFGALARSLAPGSRIYVYDSQRDASRQAAVQKDLLLSGFTDGKVDSYSGIVLVQATKPAWDLGAKASLRKPAAAAAPQTAAAAAAPKKWGVSVDDDADELMDEDELLTEEDKKPVAPKAADDCDIGSSGKKACKNCSCGRAEQEAAGSVKLTPEMLENPTSACGNCSLGDAFRCSGCPYRGLPAFEAGKKIQLGADLLTADV